jgi:hypothetical protein
MAMAAAPLVLVRCIVLEAEGASSCRYHLSKEQQDKTETITNQLIYAKGFPVKQIKFR